MPTSELQIRTRNPEARRRRTGRATALRASVGPRLRFVSPASRKGSRYLCVIGTWSGALLHALTKTVRPTARWGTNGTRRIPRDVEDYDRVNVRRCSCNRKNAADLARLAKRWCCAALLGACIASAGPNAFGDGGSPDVRRIVLVVSEGDPAGTPDHVARTIASHIRPSGVAVDVQRAPEAPLGVGEVEARSRELSGRKQAAGVFWVTAGAHELVLRLFDAARGRLFERRVPKDERAGSAALEAVALIAGSASAELLDGAITTMTALPDVAVAVDAPSAPASSSPQLTTASSEAPVVAPTPITWERPTTGAETTAPAAPRWESELDPAAPDYLARSGPKLALAPVVGFLASTSTPFALTTAVAFRPVHAFELGVGYEVILSQPSRPRPRADGDQHPAFFAASYSLAADRRWDFALGTRFVGDVVTRHAFVPERDTTDVRWSLGPTAELGFRVWSPLRIGLVMGLDVVLNSPSSSLADRVVAVTGLRAAFDMDLSPTRTQQVAGSEGPPRKH